MLGTNGQKLWDAIVREYTLRPDELMILESACQEADLIAKLEDGLKDAPLTVLGSMKQQVAHPLITEIRQHRATQAQLLKSLRLPDEPKHEAPADARTQPMTRTESAKIAAHARWNRGA